MRAKTIWSQRLSGSSSGWCVDDLGVIREAQGRRRAAHAR